MTTQETEFAIALALRLAQHCADTRNELVAVRDTLQRNIDGWERDREAHLLRATQLRVLAQRDER